MCNATAKLLRLELGDSVQLSTANGVITARRATVKSVKIGPIEVRDVAAVVKGESTPCGEILVGMSVLHKLHVTLDGQTMTLVAGGRNGKAAHWNEWSILATIMLLLLISLLGIRKRRRRSGSALQHRNTFPQRCEVFSGDFALLCSLLSVRTCFCCCRSVGARTSIEPRCREPHCVAALRASIAGAPAATSTNGCAFSRGERWDEPQQLARHVNCDRPYTELTCMPACARVQVMSTSRKESEMSGTNSPRVHRHQARGQGRLLAESGRVLRARGRRRVQPPAASAAARRQNRAPHLQGARRRAEGGRRKGQEVQEVGTGRVRDQLQGAVGNRRLFLVTCLGPQRGDRLFCEQPA